MNLIGTLERVSSLVDMVGKKTFYQITIASGEIGFFIMTQKRGIESCENLEDTVKNQLMHIYQVFERTIERALTESYEQIDNISDVDLMIKSFFGGIVIGSLSRLLVMIKTPKRTMKIKPEFSCPNRSSSFLEKGERLIDPVKRIDDPINSEEILRRRLREDCVITVPANSIQRKRRRFGHQICFFSGHSSFEEMQRREQDFKDAVKEWRDNFDVDLKFSPPFVEPKVSVRDTYKVIEKGRALTDSALDYLRECEASK